MNPASQAGPELQSLLALFPPNDYLAGHDFVAADKVPAPYDRLLVHEHHMTVTVEAHHGSLVDVQVLEERRVGESYARKILLSLQGTGRVVQFGIVRIRLDLCSPSVRREILARQTPLGRILIQHKVLRRIEPTAFLRVVPGPAMMKWFALDTPRPTYGRLALIHCDDQPAVELLEIVAPET
jgi:chorismate-pyruvate lyase